MAKNTGDNRKKLSLAMKKVQDKHGSDAVLKFFAQTNDIDPGQKLYIAERIASGKEDIGQLDAMVQAAKTNTLKVKAALPTETTPPPAPTTKAAAPAPAKQSLISMAAAGKSPQAPAPAKAQKVPKKAVQPEISVAPPQPETPPPAPTKVKKPFPQKLPEHALYNRAARGVLKDTGRKSVGKTLSMLKGAGMKGSLIEQSMRAKEALDTAEAVQNFPLAKYNPSVLNAGGGPSPVSTVGKTPPIKPKMGWGGKIGMGLGALSLFGLGKSLYGAATGGGAKVASAEKQLLELFKQQKVEEATMRFQANEPQLYQAMLNFAAGVPAIGRELTGSEVRYGGSTANVNPEDVPMETQHAMIEGLLGQ